MDHTFIINPLEEINYLFEYVFNISECVRSSPSTSEMPEERELAEMMESVSLSDGMEEERPREVIRLNESACLQNLLMQSPRTIKDFSKLEWMHPLGADRHHLLQKSTGRLNNYLSSMLSIMQDSPPQTRFQFVEIYPHTRNLAANCTFKQGETILQIEQEWIFNSKNIPKTHLIKYLQAIITLVLQGKSVFKSSGLNSEDGFIYQIRKVQNLAISLYIFEKKFIQEIVTYPFSSTKKEAFEWLYFRLLPDNFDYHPIREWEDIRPYHKDIAHHLERMEYEFIEEYKLVKQMVDGQFIKDEFSFSSFLKGQTADGLSIFEKYQRLFTPKNYVWTKLCEKTRFFQISNNNNQEYQYDCVLGQELTVASRKKQLIPFLDQFHHSTNYPNITWHHDLKTGRVTLTAQRDIKKGDLLFIKYKNTTINTCYIDYGFVDAKEIGWVDLSLAINFDMIQWIASELFQKKVKKRFITFIQKYALYHDLLAEVRIIDYNAETYNDHIIKKESVLEDVVEAYTQLTLLLLNKHDPQIHKKSYLQKEESMKHKLKKMIVRLVVTSLHNNITLRRNKIERINRDLSKEQKNWNNSASNRQRCEQNEEMNDVVYQSKQRAEFTKKFNNLYHYTCLKTILTTQITILQKILHLFEKNTLK